MIEIVFVSKDGQTEKISTYLSARFVEQGYDCRITNLMTSPDYQLPESTEYLIMGVPIRYGKPMPQLKNWLGRQGTKVATFSQHQVSAFNVNLTARKPEKSSVDTCPYAKKVQAILPSNVKHLSIFAGALDYPIYRFFDRWMIKLIMKMTHGPTDSDQRIEFTNWSRVDQFVTEVLDRSVIEPNH